MPALWTPDGSTPLIDAQADEVSVSEVVLIEPKDGQDAVVSWLWTSDPPLPDQAVITPFGNSLRVEFPDFVGMLPIQEIGYVQGGAVGFCAAWEDLPSDAEDVILYRADPVNIRTFVLSVTAEFIQSPAETVDYEIVVRANYNVGRDALQEAVNARR